MTKLFITAKEARLLAQSKDLLTDVQQTALAKVLLTITEAASANRFHILYEPSSEHTAKFIYEHLGLLGYRVELLHSIKDVGTGLQSYKLSFFISWY